MTHDDQQPARKLVLARPPCQLCSGRDAEVEVETTLGGAWAALCRDCHGKIGRGRAVELVHAAEQARPPTVAQVRRYLVAQTWVYARTMPKYPHEYVLLKRSTDPWMHLRVVAFIRSHGTERYFRPSRVTRAYWAAGDGYEYWAMDRATDTIVNRAEIGTEQ